MAESLAKRALRKLLPPIILDAYRILRGPSTPAAMPPQALIEPEAKATPKTNSTVGPKPPQQPKPADDPDFLFDGSGDRFKELMQGVKVYAEYGVGKSSSYVLRKTEAQVLAVDTDADWIRKVREEVSGTDRFDAVHVDLGPMKGWGWPVDYQHHARFQDYTDSVWTRGLSPELVLVDGRFRVCCFLTSLLKAEPGTILIFDDYVKRPHYHIVEEFTRPTEVHGRQAIFVRPDQSELDLDVLAQQVERFRYVMD